jgi:hypothetical protein
MNDTPKQVLQKQYEIISAKPLRERLKMAFDLTELSRLIISNSIRKKEPGITDIELKVKLFKTFYRFDFNQEKLDEIAGQMRQFLRRDDR